MTVSIGTVWDRTVEVLRGRAGILAPIAVSTVFLPTVVNNAIATYIRPDGAAGALLAAIVALAVLMASVWGQLAMLAVATHPATTRVDAGRQASARLLPALGIVLIVGFVASLAILPPIVALMGAGVDVARMASGVPASAGASVVSPAVSWFILIWMFALIVAAFWCGARLLLLNPVILNERLGLGAIIRSVRLTRGMTWRLIGVVMLFVVVLLVAASAVQFAVTLPLRLLLGADALPTVRFLAAIAGAATTTAFTVVAAAFTAQLYVAAAGEPTVD